jgi:hypothetical protein
MKGACKNAPTGTVGGLPPGSKPAWRSMTRSRALGHLVAPDVWGSGAVLKGLCLKPVRGSPKQDGIMPPISVPVGNGSS